MTADITPVTAAAQTYGDARAADQKAVDQKILDDTDAALAALQKKYDDYVKAHPDNQPPPPPPPPPPGSLLVGVRSDVDPMSKAVSTFGKQSTAITRLFQQGLPSAWSVDNQHWVAGQIPIVSYKSNGGNLASYAKSLEAVNGQLAYHHEPEADYGTDGAAGGKKFVAEFVADYKTAKAASSKTLFGMIAGAFQYNKNNGLGYNGDFLPPATSTDFYALDTYLVGGSAPNTIQPFETEPRFQRWYSFVKDRGKPLYITEYGRGLITDASQDSLRAKVIAQDLAYLKKIGVKAWIYWWTADGSGSGSGKNWQFKDAASITAWTNAGK